MRKLLFVAAILFLVVSGVVFSSEKGSVGHEIDSGTKEAVQATILEKINKECPGGKTFTLEGKPVEFDYLHAGVKEKDGLYVSCADYKEGSDVYDVDYYAKKWNGKYKVVKSVLHKKNGEVVNELLWEKGQKSSGSCCGKKGSGKKGSVAKSKSDADKACSGKKGSAAKSESAADKACCGKKGSATKTESDTEKKGS